MITKMTKLFTLLLVVLAAFTVQAQKQDTRTLFTIDGEPITVAEFEYVYNKNNINNQADYSKASLEEYLELYVNFRLKVQEAEDLGMDTVPSLVNELNGYKKQLSKNYLNDKEIYDALVTEAYERMKHEVNVSHIILTLDANASPKDTLAKYKELMGIRKDIMNGKLSFDEAALKYSQDPSVKNNNGNLGYIMPFQTVYPFESAAYNTPVGEVSMPFRTQFGYHIVLVNDMRENRGEVSAKHILLKLDPKADEAKAMDVEKRIHDIYSQIQSGEATFEDMAIKNSEDNFTKNKAGLLNWFGTGTMYEEFEEVAFNTPVGEVSEPFKTPIGWHIVKIEDKRGLQPLAEIKTDLKGRVQRDSRAAISKEDLLVRIKKDYQFVEYPKTIKATFDKVDENLLKGMYVPGTLVGLDKPVMELDGISYTQADFLGWLEKANRGNTGSDKMEMLNMFWDRYVEETALNYEESKLEDKYPDFKYLMKEYRDGTLLFALTDEMVWTKAVTDTTGLKAFYEMNKNNYLYGPRAEVRVYNCSDEKVAKKAKKLVDKGKSPQEVKDKLAKKGKVTTFEGKYEEGQYPLIDELGWKKGTSEIRQNPDGTYMFVHFVELHDPEPKELQKAKGYVVSDYQDYLEDQWVEHLRDKYNVELNQEVFNSLIKK